MFEKILIANRGAIACRIIRTLRHMHIRSVAIYTEADALSQHVAAADEAYCIGDGVASESYLRIDKVLVIAKQSGAQAIHPGYGFLSENAAFAEACARQGICFIGPTPEQMRTFGLKHTARVLALQNQVPLLSGSELLDSIEAACQQADHIGYPVMLKSTAGGGGIGMRLCWNQPDLINAYDAVKTLAQNNFKDAGLFIEKYVEQARHIEVQIFGDGKGAVIALGERDCSMQRRNQKVIEETPAPNLTQSMRQALLDTAVRLGKAVNYQSAGTVEYIFDDVHQQFYFLEVNTRLQVEHGITEEVTGIDLVEWMIRQASGNLPALDSFPIQPKGCAIQARVYAENPAKAFQPSSGILTEVIFSNAARIETWIERGVEVSAFYDPMLAKVIVNAADRSTAIAKLCAVLEETSLQGIETNLDYLQQILHSDAFQGCRYSTQYLNGFRYHAHTIDVLQPGVQTTIQDYPGRIGYWNVGVPPSGPMDHLAFRFANRLVNNPENCAGLEMTLAGPTLRFNCDSIIAICGAAMEVFVNDTPLAQWQSHSIKAGSELRFGKVVEAGNRAYLAVQGGFQVPDYLNSKATFILGQFGGHAGRVLRVGDVLHIKPIESLQSFITQAVAEQSIPRYGNTWDIHVLYGPHGAPDFFTENDIEQFFATEWKVHHNSSRTGVRLMGPRPQWARMDGGEAGLHPSNIHDNAYAVGAIDFTGDMPIILGPDGPSLGGFVCPAVVVQAELWKIGQLRPGDHVRFHPISQEQALTLENHQQQWIDSLQPISESSLSATIQNGDAPILQILPANDTDIQVVYRPSGDRYVLIEYGDAVLDLNLRFRIHALMQALQQAIEQKQLTGIIDITPGIRSLQIHFDSHTLPRQQLLNFLIFTEKRLPTIESMEVSSRIVHLPLCWNDSATQLAIEKYMQSVRADAPWCPSNIEFIRRMNGLDSIDDVKEIVYQASYLVMGLGDVYLGAPVATPLDPRHRLVTTKYNPARTWTPENAVGIGGAYLCIYGMEGPGGYQFVGRTVPMWNRYRETTHFKKNKPWLLRFFDQIRFYPVTENELRTLRKDLLAGRFQLEVQESSLNLKRYHDFLQRNEPSIAAFKTKQQAAFEAERKRWKVSEQSTDIQENSIDSITTETECNLPENAQAICTYVTGVIWKLLVQEGGAINKGQTVAIVESMKMEFTIEAPADGRIHQILSQEGSYVSAGQAILSYTD